MEKSAFEMSSVTLSILEAKCLKLERETTELRARTAELERENTALRARESELESELLGCRSVLKGYEGLMERAILNLDG